MNVSMVPHASLVFPRHPVRQLVSPAGEMMPATAELLRLMTLSHPVWCQFEGTGRPKGRGERTAQVISCAGVLVAFTLGCAGGAAVGIQSGGADAQGAVGVDECGFYIPTVYVRWCDFEPVERVGPYA